MIGRREFLAGAVAAPLVCGAAQPAVVQAHFRASPAAPDAIAEEARRLVRAAVEALGGMSRFVARGNTVWVKPNISWDRRPEQAACTNPDVVAALVELAWQAGARKVWVGDNPCQTPERTLLHSGIAAAARKAGAECEVLDERKFRRMPLTGAQVLKQWELYVPAMEADVLINAGIVKQHSLTRAVLGMKNLMGIAGGARNRFHQDIGRAVADLAGFVKPRLTVLDAIRVLAANGPTGGNLDDVRRRDTLIAGVDPVAVDAAGARILEIEPMDVSYVAEAQARGLGDLRAVPLRVEV